MKSIKTLIDDSKSNRANAADLKQHPEQLKRWIKNDAHYTEDGSVYIKTVGSLKHITKEKENE